MGCGASADVDSDSQASLEDWETVASESRRRSPPPSHRRLSEMSDDMESDDSGTGVRKSVRDDKTTGYKQQQGAKLATVQDMVMHPPVTDSGNMGPPEGDEGGGFFVDKDFPPSETALYHHRRPRDPKLVWLRPHELVPKPELMVNGISRHDIVQGALADCWFLSSCAAVAQRPDLMEKVIPGRQPLVGDSYKGIVTFRFWRFGHWVTVYVDDLLPTKNKRLLFSRSSEHSEFWVSLLEKAYAKLHGSYEALEGGQAMDALVDLTGGLAEMYVLETAPPHLYFFLLQASTSGAFVTCSRKGDWSESMRADANGLVSGHAYTISAVATVKLSTGTEAFLLRIRNPWGNDTEWNGKWNDGDSNWNRVDSSTRQLMGYSRRRDGEFWMSYQDFCREFEEVTICSLTPDLAYASSLKGAAQQQEAPQPATVMKSINGSWEEGKSCGGSRNNLVSFATNPQFMLVISKSSRNSESKKCHVVVALMQLRRRCVRHPGRRMLQIAFVLFKVDAPEKQTLQNFLKIEEVGNSGPYVNYREVFARFELWPGYYVIVPATFEPGSPGSFYIRVYADTPATLSEL